MTGSNGRREKPIVISGLWTPLLLALLLLFSPLIAIFFLFLRVFREPILQGKLFPRLRVFFALSYILPVVPTYPKDFHSRILEFPMDLDSAERTYTSTLQHRYAGAYVLQLVTERPPPFGAKERDPYNIGATITTTFRRNGTSVHTLTVHPGDLFRPFFTWDKSGKKSGGLTLAEYLVPQDAPQGTVLDCECQVQLLNTRLKDMYENVRLIIAKASEE
jgi:hypothetical protein